MALDSNLTVKIGACNRITLQGSNRRELIVNPNSETVFAVSCSLLRTGIDFADKEGELFKNEIYGSSVFVSSPTEEEEKKAWPGISRHFLYTTQPCKRPEANRQPVASQSARSVFELIVLWLVFIRTNSTLFLPFSWLVKAGKEKGPTLGWFTNSHIKDFPASGVLLLALGEQLPDIS